MLRYLPYFKIVLAGYASPVLTVMGAVATGLSKRKQISAAFRQKLAVLAGLMGGHSSGANPPALLKLSLPLPDAARIWRQQVGAIQNSVRKFAGTVKGERVQSLVLEGAIALEARGAQQAGEILVDVYLWADDLPDAVGDALERVKNLPDRVSAAGTAMAAGVNGYVLRPAAANLNQAWQGAARFVTRTQLDRLARNSVQLMSNGSALLAAGSGVFSALALLDAWEKFEHGSVDEREKAAVSLLTAGLGLSAALLSVGAEIADQASKQALKDSLKKKAGIIGAIATAIDAVKSVIQAFSEYSKENYGTSGLLVLQGLLLIGAAGAGLGVALGVGSTVILGLSVTGWGLILVALGIIVGFIIAALQDTPTEEWAGQTFWGRYPDKWGSLKREQEELNKLLIGVRVDFDFRSRLTNLGNYGRAIKRGMNPIGNAIETVRELWNGQPVGPKVTREAWARVMLPEVLESSMPWAVRIVAKKKNNKEALVAYYSHHPGGMAFIVARRGRQLEHEIEEVAPEATEARKNGVWTVELSAQLDVNVYREAWAEVVIYGDAEAEETPLVDQTLKES